MNPVMVPGKHKCSDDDSCGEIKIERVPHRKIEIKRRDLLPVFENFRKFKPDWSSRDDIVQRYPTSTSVAHSAEEKYSSGPAVYPQPVQNFPFGPSLPAAQMCMNNSHLGHPHNANVKDNRKVSSTLLKTDNSVMDISSPVNSSLVNSSFSLRNASSLAGRAVIKEVQSSNSDASNGSSNRWNFSMNIVDEASVEDPVDLGGYLQAEYCRAVPLDVSGEMSEVVTDVDSSSSPRDEGDGENDEMLGGVFAFCEYQRSESGDEENPRLFVGAASVTVYHVNTPSEKSPNEVHAAILTSSRVLVF